MVRDESEDDPRSDWRDKVRDATVADKEPERDHSGEDEAKKVVEGKMRCLATIGSGINLQR